MRDRQTGKDVTLTIIGILSESTPVEMAGIATSQKTVTTHSPAAPTRRSSTSTWLRASCAPSASEGDGRGLVPARVLVHRADLVVGTLLGLLLAWNIIADTRQQPSWENLTLVVPWLNLAVIFLLVYAVAMIATIAPARRAARVRPAEALRYE